MVACRDAWILLGKTTSNRKDRSPMTKVSNQDKQKPEEHTMSSSDSSFSSAFSSTLAAAAAGAASEAAGAATAKASGLARYSLT